MTAVEESPILIPSEDEDEDDDIVVVKEEKIPITIDETEDGDQDGEVIFVAQTSAPSPSTWGRADADSSRLRLISEKETTAAAAALAPAHCSTNLSAIASVSTAISPSPCSADLSSIEDVGDDLGEGHESKPTLQRNLSLASAVDFSLSLEDADQSPLDLSKNSSADGKPGAGVDLSVLGSHHRASRYVNDVDSVGGVQMLASPFAIPSSSQAVISAGCPQVRQLGVADSSNTSAVLVNQDLKVGVQDQRRTSGALEVADVLMDFSAASTSSQMVGSTNLPSMSSVGSAGPVKLSPASSTSTDSSTQLLVDFLMQDDQLSQVLVPATTCSGSSLSSSHAQASGTVQSVVPSQSSVPCPQPPYLGQSSTSGNSAVIQTKSHFMHATKPEDLSPGGVSTQGLCVPGVRVLVGSPTLGFQQQPSTSGGANVAPTLDFAQIIAQVLDQQTDASSSGSSGAASSMMSSSSSLSSASTSSAALSSLSSSLPSTLSSSVGSVRTLYSSSNASFDNVNPAPTTAKTSGPALVSAKRNSTNSLSTLDSSSLPPRKRVRSLIIDSSSSVASSVGGKSMSFSGTSTAADAGTSSSDQGSNAVGSTTAASSSSVLPRPEDGGACERCQNSIIGTQLSRCTQGHRACGLCLEEQVKLVLTGRQKGSLKCISSNCSSYYPMSELKHSLPNMVVEILEDKLDRDYVEYISDMMLSNATSNSATNSTTTSSAATTTTAAAATISATPPPSTSKSSAEVQTSDNSDIDDNTDDNDADDSEDDSDNSTTSSSEMSTSTASTATIKRTIPTTKGKKLLPKSSSSSLSSLTSDDAIVPTTTSTTDLDNDDDNISGDDEVYDDVADDYDEVMQRGGMGRGEGKCSGRWSRDRDDRQKDFPDNWVKMDNTTTLLAVPLKPDSEEYIEVAIRFHTTMTFPQADVTQILRIQNPIMWKYYSLKRLEMVQENDGLSVEEKMLFHGTKCSVIDAICRKGFDWRVCGKHGTAYGHGCYFARDSIYSHNYTDRTTEASQASVVLRSVSASSSSQPEREGGSSSSNHLTPASVNLSSLNPQPSQAGSPGAVHHHSKYHHVNPGLMGGRWSGTNVPSASSSGFPVHMVGPAAGGGGGSSAGAGGNSSGTGSQKTHLWQRRQFLRKILSRVNPVMYQPSGAGPGGQPQLQNIPSHPAYHKPVQPPKPILPKSAYQPTASIPSVMGGHASPSSQGGSSRTPGMQMGSARPQPPSSSSSTQQGSGSNNFKPKIVSVMVGPYTLPKPPPSQSSNPQPLQGPGMGQQGVGSSGGLVPSFTGSLPGGGVMVGGSGSAPGPVPGPGSGFSLGPLSSAHRNSLLFLSQQPPITPPHLLSHPMGHIAHSHQQSAAHSSHLPPWVRLPAGPPPPHGIAEQGKYSAGSRYMFLAKVLVGRSTGGCSGFRRPPPLDQSEPFGKCYDSCVDNIFDPKIFVIFDSNQAYPEYIVEYKFVE